MLQGGNLWVVTQQCLESVPGAVKVLGKPLHLKGALNGEITSTQLVGTVPVQVSKHSEPVNVFIEAHTTNANTNLWKPKCLRFNIKDETFEFRNH